MAAPSVKVGFVLLSPAKAPVPSTRVAVLNMFPYLRAAGFSPEIVFEPARATESPDLRGIDADALLRQGIRVVCFQKVGGAHVEALARALSVRGIKTLFMVCDVVDAIDGGRHGCDGRRHRFPEAAVPGAAATQAQRGARRHRKACSAARRACHAARVDHPAPARRAGDFGPPRFPACARRATAVAAHHGGRPLRRRPTCGRPYARIPMAFSPAARLEAEGAGPGLWPESAYPLRPVGSGGVYDWLRAADIGIIPIETPPPSPSDTLPPSWKVKSENRLTLKMSMGLPVIATPIPAYESVVRQGVDGFLAQSRADWLKHLEELRDPAHRRQIGHAAPRQRFSAFFHGPPGREAGSGSAQPARRVVHSH